MGYLCPICVTNINPQRLNHLRERANSSLGNQKCELARVTLKVCRMGDCTEMDAAICVLLPLNSF
jgi:hypothetical protein